MFQSVTNLAIVLIKNVSVIVLLAYILTRTKWFSEILERKFNYKNQIFMILTFGIFSIYGTLSGESYKGAIINIRDLGPVIAGLLGGPISGLGAGLIGSVHRFLLGGKTCIPCSVTTLFAGVFAGAIFMLRKGKFVGILNAVIIMIIMELFHMWLSLVTVKPYEMIYEIVKKFAFPMLFANAVGMGAFAFMIHNLIRERQVESAKKMIEAELKVAHEIQLSIIPKLFPPFPNLKEFDIYAIIHPAKEVGGDLYDFFLLDDNHLCITIGDVSGKGVPASLFMAVTNTLIKAKSEKGITPDRVLYNVNNELYKENDSMMFVSLFMGILNIQTGEMIYSNGGHNIPYILKKDGNIHLLDGAKGKILGVFENSQYTKSSVKMSSGDAIFFYTDGVSEAMNENSQLFTEKRLENLLSKIYSLATKELIDSVLNEIKIFVGEAEQSDDITMVVLRYNKTMENSLNLELKNNLKEIGTLINSFESFAEKFSLSKSVVNDINLCLEELVTNVISYGYNDQDEHIIFVDISFINDAINICIKDDGLEFNPLEQAEPDINQPIEERKIGGLGIHLVKNLMSDLAYKRENDFNILTMRKFIR